MKNGFYVGVERLVVGSSLAIAAVTLMGVKSCDLSRDYYFATQVNIAVTATVTPEGTLEDGLATVTPTAVGTDVPVDPTDTPEPTSTSIVSLTVQPTLLSTTTPIATSGIQDSNIFTQLRALDNPAWQDTPKPLVTLTPAASALTTAGMISAAVTSNWLGNLYGKGDGEKTPFIDSDSDGFSDSFEKAHNTNPNDAADYPHAVTTTSLRDAKAGVDTDGDGLTDEQERELGTDPRSRDTDRDGILDGNEVLSNSLPRDRSSRPIDADGDGLSDDAEKNLGLNPAVSDTDGDGLSDGEEQAIGSNPFVKDTDGDGIIDSKEFELGSNPSVADR